MEFSEFWPENPRVANSFLSLDTNNNEKPAGNSRLYLVPIPSTEKKTKFKNELLCQPIISSIGLSIQAITKLIKNKIHASACTIRLLKKKAIFLLLFAIGITNRHYVRLTKIN